MMMKKRVALLLSMVALMALFAGCKKVGEVASDVGRTTSEVLSQADKAVSETVSRLEDDARETESRIEDHESRFEDETPDEFVSPNPDEESVLPED